MIGNQFMISTFSNMGEAGKRIAYLFHSKGIDKLDGQIIFSRVETGECTLMSRESY